MSGGTEELVVRNRWTGIRHIRRGSPRSTRPVATAKLVHTSRGGRRIELFVTKPLMDELGWEQDGIVSARYSISEDQLALSLSPAHRGLTAHKCHRKTTTCRIAISGSLVAQSACAPVRAVPYSRDGATLIVALPREWASSAGDAA